MLANNAIILIVTPMLNNLLDATDISSPFVRFFTSAQ